MMVEPSLTATPSPMVINSKSATSSESMKQPSPILAPCASPNQAAATISAPAHALNKRGMPMHMELCG